MATPCFFRVFSFAALGGRLGESKAHGDGNGGRDQQEKDETLAPEIAPTVLIAQFVEMGKRLGRFRTRVVRVINDEAARGDPIVTQDHPPTGH